MDLYRLLQHFELHYITLHRLLTKKSHDNYLSLYDSGGLKKLSHDQQNREYFYTTLMRSYFSCILSWNDYFLKRAKK